jgi:hypothetical protein
MLPLFIYKTGNKFLVLEIGKEYSPSKLVASIDAARWLETYLNYDKKNRNRMVRELEGRE